MTETITTRDRIVASSLTNGGGTFEADGSSVTSGTAVTVAVLDKVSEGDLALAIHNFEPFITEGNYVGTWFDEENGVWEISETAVFADRADAVRLARVLAERYVYDIDAQECVDVRGESMEITEGCRVRGEAGVFYADRAAEGVVLNFVAGDGVHVALDDGDRAVVPTACVTRV